MEADVGVTLNSVSAGMVVRPLPLDMRQMSGRRLATSRTSITRTAPCLPDMSSAASVFASPWPTWLGSHPRRHSLF